MRKRTVDDLARAFGEVQLATLSAEVPRGAGWSYELKYDGYRILALKSGKDVRLWSRRQQDWTAQFSAVASAVARLAAPGVVIDGEVCALDAGGRPSFQLLQNRSRAARLVYFVFDLLYDGEDLRPSPLAERRRRLESIAAPAAGDGVVLLSASVTGDGAAILKSACAGGLEGVVAKQSSSPYAPGRSRTWLKIKCTLRQEFAIVGWQPLEGTKTAVGSLVLALMGADGRFHFAGKVGTGFDTRTRKDLWRILRDDETPSSDVADLPRLGADVHFVEPRHVAEVQFTEWTSGGHVRHPSFQGLREDKTPADCMRERPRPAPKGDDDR